jgi:ribosomal protein S12 methylthiotransferase
MNNTFHIISLGCAKNTVDSYSITQLLTTAGYRYAANPRQAGIIIVNTCGFIDTAKEESLGILADLAKKKRKNQLLIAAGCLTQRYRAEVSRSIPGIDGIIGTRHWMDIVKVIRQIQYQQVKSDAGSVDTAGIRQIAIQGASAYLKIADGCRRTCAFCAIPLIKGTAVSRTSEAILADAIYLQEKGIKEIILIAQDTTDYGHDLGLKNGLALLLQKMVNTVPGVDWIRIMYAYPGYVTDELIEAMANNKQIVPYLDIPLQHAHPATLRRMSRPANLDWIYQTIEKMRRAIPGLAIRTTFIVGYPDETEEEFQALLDFIGEIRFDKVGAFKYSFEPGTASEALGDTIPDKVKEERLERLMEKQQQISLEINQTFINRNLDVLIEGSEQGISVGRSYRDAPEIDGLVVVKGEVPVGQFIPVSITGATTYDLSGIVSH